MFTPADIMLYVPSFNAGTVLDQCLAGIAGQTVKPAQILLIDDGSVPPLRAGEFQIIRHPVNRGLGAARNTALNSCETGLLASVDADIKPDPDWLELMLNSINRDGADGIGGMAVEYHQATPADRWRAVHMAQHWGNNPTDTPRFLFGCNTLFLTESLRKAGGYDESLRSNNEDRTISRALIRRGAKLRYIPTARCRHLRRDTNRSILPGFWLWHHAAGLKYGDFDTPEGLLDRISRVNFGIFRYRFDLDREAQREELLGLDATLPWVFCAQDLLFYHRRTGKPVPALTRAIEGAPEIVIKALHELVPAGSQEPHHDLSWASDYANVFSECLHRFNWLRDCLDPAIWRPLAVNYMGPES